MDRNAPRSLAAREAASILGKMIRSKRIKRRMTAAQLAERAGITRGTLRCIERGETGTAIGTVFEVATLVGIQLFGQNADELAMHNRRLEEELALLPRSAHFPKSMLDNNF